MNCKPGQMAWIKVSKRLSRFGIEQLHGRVVRTVRLLPEEGEPTWIVEPDQWVTITHDTIDAKGTLYRAGERVPAHGIPDAMLRPFDPNSEPQDDDVDVRLPVEAEGA